MLTRVLVRLGDLELITTREIEGLFAVDLAFLQDFYGVINFGDQAEFEALVAAQAETRLVGSQATAAAAAGCSGPAPRGRRTTPADAPTTARSGRTCAAPSRSSRGVREFVR